MLKTQTNLIVRSAVVKQSVRNHISFRDMLKRQKEWGDFISVVSDACHMKTALKSDLEARCFYE